MVAHVANAPRNHVTDAILAHAAARDAKKAKAHSKAHSKKNKPTLKLVASRDVPVTRPATHSSLKRSHKAKTAALAATPIYAAPTFETPGERKPGILRSTTRNLVVKPLGFAKNMMQGALSGLMTFFSALQFSGAEVASLPKITADLPASWAAMLDGFPAGAATGVLGIIGAAILYMNAGKSIARVLGLLAFIAIVTAYANGANKEDLIPFLTSLYHQLKLLMPFLAGVGL